jgi:drug/metabolite transporter (DMT)-like permease
MRTSAPTSRPGVAGFTWAGLFHLAVIYFVWGSGYLAVRVAVRGEGGFPPFALGASRLLVASTILLLVAGVRRQLRMSKRELGVLAASGVLLWVGGAGLVNWALQYANAGYSAIIVGSAPIFSAAIEAIVDRRWPSALLTFSLLLGLAGLGLLTTPTFESGTSNDVLAVIALVAGSITWSMATVLQARKPVGSGPGVSSGYQQLFGCLGFVVVMLLLREPMPTPSTRAWLAWGYLVIFGSLVAFTSYVASLRLLPVDVVMTHAYVNPVITVTLGWFVLHEPVTPWMLGGGVLVLVGVAGVFRDSHLRVPEATLSTK